MKTLIIALNSKYIHSALAPWYLKAACKDTCGEVGVAEFTINENPETVLAAIYAEKAEVAAFSCYIWNIGQVLRIAENLKKIRPGMILVFGGPEVSYDPVALLQESPQVDYVVSGEGEVPFPKLLECIHTAFRAGSGKPEHDVRILDKLQQIPGLTYRNGDKVESNPPGLPVELSGITSPYSGEMLEAIKGKIAYFEASRGCPFSCSYCLSSADEGVRFFPAERVKEELKALVNAGVRQVKFVDRTFNCNKERAKDILRFIAALKTEASSRNESASALTNFHFEAAADLFDDELITILASLPKGLVQLEIGVQTTNTDTLMAVSRKTDIDKAFKNIRRILQPGNIHLHLDLIAGLPYEDFDSFGESFDNVYGLKPHTLQLGFLKLLKGSPIRRESGRHGYIFRDYAPYEVLSNKYIGYDELTVLKGVEELLDRYWNSGRFTVALEYIVHKFFSSAFEFYLGFYRYNLSVSRNIQSVSSRDLTAFLLEYATSLESIDIVSIKECLKLDFLASDSSGHLPEGLERSLPPGFLDRCHEFLRNPDKLAEYLPQFIGTPAKQIMKQVHFEVISMQVFLFDYTDRDTVTGRYKFIPIDFAISDL